MLTARSSHRRGGALALTLSGIAAAAICATAAASFHSGARTASVSVGSVSENAAAKPTARRLQPGEVATVLQIIGLSPEALASAGVTGLQCDDLFSVATTYCLQAERLAQFQIAYGNLNKAKQKEVHPNTTGPVDGDGNPITSDQCQAAITDLENAAFSFVTTDLDAGTIAKLSTIRANRSWGLAQPYLTVNRTDQQWLALRGALVARRFAQDQGFDVPQGPADVLSATESDDTVAQALRDYAANLADVKTSFANH